MARSPWRIIMLSVLAAVAVWIWILVFVLFSIRWNRVDRPGPHVFDAFPYGEIRIGVDASYPPFAVATADDLFGLDIDLGKAIAEHLNAPVRFVNMGYDGLYDSLRADQVDIVISALLIDPARRGDVRYTYHYFDAGLVLVSPVDSPLTAMENLPGYSLAYEFGSAADAEAKQWSRRVGDFETMPYELPAYALDAVRLGEADAALVDAISYRLYLRNYPDWPTQFTSVTESLYAIAVRVDRGGTWELVNGALRDLIESGTLDAIIDRWL